MPVEPVTAMPGAEEAWFAWFRWIRRQPHDILPTTAELVAEVIGEENPLFALERAPAVEAVVVKLRDAGFVAMAQYECPYCGAREHARVPMVFNDCFWEAHRTFGQRRCPVESGPCAAS